MAHGQRAVRLPTFGCASVLARRSPVRTSFAHGTEVLDASKTKTVGTAGQSGVSRMAAMRATGGCGLAGS